MKAKLIKTSKDYYHLVIEKSNYYYGHTSPEFCELQNKDGSYTHKLSLKNCDEIFGVVDAEKLAEESVPDGFRTIWKNGFNKAMELNKDKFFTLDDIYTVFIMGRENMEHEMNRYVDRIHEPTEIEVEIKMEPCFYDSSLGGFSTSYTEDKPKEQPKLDKDGCLILKKI
jgi:hypothetical protein